MRSLLSFLTLGVVIGLAWFLRAEIHRGSRLRDLEVQAAAHTEQIMRAQEAHRLRSMSEEEAPLYVSLAELADAGLLEGFQSLSEAGGNPLHARGGYLFLMQLLPSSNPDSVRPQLGQRYRLWVWPRSREHLGLVIYYGSSAGFLFQGENGEASGLEPVLPESTPLQALDSSRNGRAGEARRWKQLVDIRSS